MRRPGRGVDEELDHERHAQERGRRQASAQAQHQQDREGVFGVGRQVGRYVGRKQRQTALVFEQRNRGVSDAEQALDRQEYSSCSLSSADVEIAV